MNELAQSEMKSNLESASPSTSTARRIILVFLGLFAVCVVVCAILAYHYDLLTQCKQSLRVSAKISAVHETQTLPFSDSSSHITEFETYEGRFSVITPSPLHEIKADAGTSVGKTGVRILKVREGSVTYSVMYMDRAPILFRILQILASTRTSEAELDKYRDRLVRNLNGRLVSETRITFDGNPGVELVIDAPAVVENERVVKVRVFPVNNNLYQLMVQASYGELDTRAVRDFFNSFKMMSK